jgi:hypothetical protein
MRPTKGNGLTTGNSQPAKGHIKNTADFIALFAITASQIKLRKPDLDLTTTSPMAGQFAGFVKSAAHKTQGVNE